MSASWDLTPSRIPDENHGFFLLADPQTLDEPDVARFHRETVPDVRGLIDGTEGEWFGVSCGDIMFDRLELFPQYEEAVRRTGIPFYQVLGNHDVEVLAQSDESSAQTFMRYFGPNYYSFHRGRIHYVVLDDVFWHGGGYLGYVGQEQLDWLAADLAFIERGSTVVVLTHIPPYSSQNERENKGSVNNRIMIANRDALYRLLEPFRARIIAGHMHESEHVVDKGVNIHVCGAVCGAWWTSPVCPDGTPNGYGVFDVRGEEIRWRYKSTGKPLSHQIRQYDRGSDPAQPQSIIANVWDADESWKVVWYENGERRGLMRRTRGYDPLARRLHLGKDLPAKHPWVEPYVTDHLYYAEPQSPESTIIIEATDNWGRVYREGVSVE
jgi:Icc-related predicted phosphoesterase